VAASPHFAVHRHTAQVSHAAANHWAKTYLTEASLLESTRRGHFRITERGRQVIASHPARIDNDFLNQFAGFRQFKDPNHEFFGLTG
jgi:restriction endonuclease Mrr